MTTQPATTITSLEARRVSLGWSRAKLAQRAGLTPQAVWSAERQPDRGRRPETLAKIAAALSMGEATVAAAAPEAATSLSDRTTALEQTVRALEARLDRTERLLDRLDHWRAAVLAELDVADVVPQRTQAPASRGRRQS